MFNVRPRLEFTGFIALALTLFIFTLSQDVWATTEGSQPVEVVSSSTFDQTVDKVRTLVAKDGMMVMGEINQGKMLSMTGLKLNGITFLIGNPTVGKKVFSVEPAAGLAIPIRLYIFENRDNKVIISYYKPSDLLSHYHNPEVDMVGKMLDEKLANLTTMASK
jgi:uncharacterized protein (DUF302 family)